MGDSSPKSPVSSQAGQPAGNCSHCKTSRTGPTLRCLLCGDLIHLSCQYKLFLDNGNDGPKNRPDWLLKFINYAALGYRCKACIDSIRTVPPKPETMDTCRFEAAIANLDAKIQSIQDSMAKLSLPTSCDAPKPHHSTYAQAVSADDVKTAVAEVIQKQQRIVADKCCIVVYGFPEEGNDSAQLSDMLDFLGCSEIIFHYSRIGWLSHHTSKIRPVKLELNSVNNASLILSRANHLKDDEFYAGVRLCKWLSDEEMKATKQRRLECQMLNKQHPCDQAGQKSFVVIDGAIMRRGPNGRLQPYRQPKPVPNVTSSSQPKNVKQGSHETPLAT